MHKFNKHFLMNAEEAAFYCVNRGIFNSDSKLTSREIGDGNINYIFQVTDESNSKSVVVKQADKLLRSSGRPLATDRIRIEAEALKIQQKFAPGFVPEIYHYDSTMCTIIMEDISEYRNLRTELLKSKIYTNFADNITTFLVDTSLPTTDLIMCPDEKKEYVKKFINPELCDISERLVFTEPYTNDKNRNIVVNENRTFVEKNLYLDSQLHAEVAKLKINFMSNAQALIHGDLHTGSIFINKNGIKIIDPEFAFYGPIGYDLGNVIGNLCFAMVNKKHTMKNSEEKVTFMLWIRKTIADVFDMFADKFRQKYKELLNKSLYTNADFESWYLCRILADSIGSAGLEINRRVVGDAKVSDITGIEDPQQRVFVERELLTAGITMIKKRGLIKTGEEIIELFS